ncbi:DCP2-domain-containing protein [Sodiomyces alkalinus F11]|uniref:DCP2-domain-containing protein n=1 Tax=Sodiomyces alkalinus (strain CBS 110278 / VKM F-3762 / F11) TaxID=1314773 RepID=A0A3N2Q7W4_SODAK|nr:DCP2-domain-containing protein [Sodiomyces alkalinus F11]ROT42777.1 DCP2-domain-containing protein [Sodiomyces alkalinus F11]
MAGDKMQLEDWLDDLCVRFIINLPEEDLSSVARICFQVEEAQWFYEDFIRPLDPSLPSMTLRSFSLRIFQHCPLLAPFSVENHTKAFEEFLQYKTRVPVRGAILLNEEMDSTVLVKGWKKGANWSFPRGKINKDEDDLECAIREVYEETGYDLKAAGLVPVDRNVKYIEITMREQQMRLYVFRNVPMDTHFEPRTRKEISKIQWYKLSELPAFRKRGNNNSQNDAVAASNANKFYMVAPFLVPLKKWVMQQKKDEAKANQGVQFQPQNLYEEPVTEDDVWTQAQPPSKTPQRTPALDTLEGATKELQRLLKVQPATQSLQMSSHSQANRDRGASLLALLQASTAKASQALAPSVLHGLGDQTTGGIPRQLAQYQQHHPQQWAPSSNNQAPEQLSSALPGRQQSWNPQNSIANAAASHEHGQPIPLISPQAQIHPTLRHPQPLPPHVLINSGNFPNTPPVPKEATSQGFQILSRQHPGVPYAQNPNMPGGRPQPRQLSNQSMALLDVFKSGSSKTSDPSRQPNPLQLRASPSAAPISPGSIPVNQATPTQQHYGPQGALQQVIPPHPLPPVPPSQGTVAPARGHPTSEQHRSALLQMFKKTEPSISPISQQSTPTQQTTAPPTSKEAFYPAADGGPAIVPRQQQTLASHATSDLGGTVSPKTSKNTAMVNPTISHPYRILQRTGSAGRHAVSRPPPLDPASVAPHNTAGQNKPSSLASPPATSSFPAPSATFTKQPLSSEQRQKLLSLFGKPQSTSPGVPPDNSKGKAVDAGPYSVSPRPGAAAGTPPVGQALPGGATEQSRGSQPPISPADRSFLLSYLASATGGVK